MIMCGAQYFILCKLEENVAYQQTKFSHSLYNRIADFKWYSFKQFCLHFFNFSYVHQLNQVGTQVLWIAFLADYTFEMGLVFNQIDCEDNTSFSSKSVVDQFV